ncbi:MAG: CinA family protein [Bacteroidaceae bacterium]|nr:CinA family protein [Bacteroidaceae bacterium]MBR4336799.1 CinA family protein [Bacteroidaceae bacterium]
MKQETRTTARAIVKALTAAGRTVATAESCTGGGIAAALTSISGSSAVVRGGIVSYATEVKHDLLHVKADTLRRYDVVSEPVVTEMALGALKALKADLAVATSGVAGPSGGTAEIPVGTVWMAVATREGKVATHCVRGDDLGRTRNTQRAVLEALRLLLDVISSPA